MAKSITFLLENHSGDDIDGSAVKIPDYGGPLRHGVFSAYVWATSFDSATVAIEVSPDGTNWFRARRIDETQALFTVSDVETVYLKGVWVRASVTGAATASISGLSVGFCA